MQPIRDAHSFKMKRWKKIFQEKGNQREHG